MVLDASVLVKWLLADPERETETDKATAEADVDALCLLEWPVADDVAVYRRAARIAAELRHHLFDTLYHAVALEAGATLVTADRVYWRKARHIGQVALLEEFIG